MNEGRRALDALPVFQSLPAAERRALIASFAERRYSPGQSIESRLGDDPVILGVLLGGDAEWKADGPGLVNLHVGESFGDLSTDHRFDSNVTVTARRDATFALFTRGVFMAFAAAHPEAVVSLFRSFATSLRLAEQQTRVRPLPHRRSIRMIVARIVHRMFSH